MQYRQCFILFVLSKRNKQKMNLFQRSKANFKIKQLRKEFCFLLSDFSFFSFFFLVFIIVINLVLLSLKMVSII